MIDRRGLLASGWKYGGTTHGTEVWESPDGRTMFLDEALSELEDQPKEANMPTPEGEVIPNIDGTDPLDAPTVERLLDQEYSADDEYGTRQVYRAAFKRARLDGARTMRGLWDFLDRVAADKTKGQADILRKDLDLPTFEEVAIERKVEQARNTPPSPARIVPNATGGWDSEPIRHEQHLRGIDALFGEIPSEAEVEKAERREQELREADEERAAARRREAERRPEPSLPDGWFGGQ